MGREWTPAPAIPGSGAAVPDPAVARPDAWLYAPVAALFYFFVFFPYIQVLPIATDTQPNALLVAGAIFLATTHRRMAPEVFLLLLAFAFAVALSLASGLNFNSARSIGNYGSLFFISFAACALFQRNGFPVGILKAVIATWFVVGLIQTFVYSDFLVSLISRGLGTAGSGGRGVVGLAAEPTHYGKYCLLLLALTWLEARRGALSRREARLLGALLIVQTVLFAKSSEAVLLLALLLCYIAVVNFLSLRMLLRIVVGVAAVAVLVLVAVEAGVLVLNDTRMFTLFSRLLADPVLLLMVDGSVNDRFFHIVLSHYEAFRNFLLPHGFDQWIEYLMVTKRRLGEVAWGISYTRIMSGYGAALYELGFMGLLVPIALNLGLYRFFRPDTRTFLVVALFLNTMLVGTLPLSTPPLAFLIGYLAFYASEGREPEMRSPRSAPETSDA